MSEINFCPHCGHDLTQYSKGIADGSDQDHLLPESISFAITAQSASASLLQRRFKIGYARAARLMDILEEYEIVGPADGAKPRKVLFANEFDYEYSVALSHVVMTQKASTTMLQKTMGIDVKLAKKIMNRLETEGVISKPDGSRHRKVLRLEE